MRPGRPYTTRRRSAVAAALIVAATSTAAVDVSSKPRPPSVGCRTVLACRAQVMHLRQAVAWQRHERARRLRAFYLPQVMPAISAAALAFNVPSYELYGIARCETGGTFDPNARNGKYLGLFQLGPAHRADPIIRYLGWQSPIAQALHTARYIKLHGPGEWQCKPNGSLRW